MRKQQKLELEMAIRSAELICPTHGLNLVRHMLDTTPRDMEGCWDCPAPNCKFHVHESPQQSQRWGDRLLTEHRDALASKQHQETKQQ